MQQIYANLERLEGIEARLHVAPGEFQTFAQAQIALLRVALETEAVALETDATEPHATEPHATEPHATETFTVTLDYIDALTSVNYIQALVCATSKEQVDPLLPLLNQDDVFNALITACKENRPDIVRKFLSDKRIVSDSNWWKAYDIVKLLYPTSNGLADFYAKHPITEEFTKTFRYFRVIYRKFTTF